jgi:hypothetical protein
VVVDNGRVDDAADIDTRKASLKRKIAETEDVICTDRAISLPFFSSSEQPSPPKRSCQGWGKKKTDPISRNISFTVRTMYIKSYTI